MVMGDQSGQARGIDRTSDDTPAAPSGRFGRRAVMLGAAATGAGVAASLAGGGAAGAAEPAAKGAAVLLGQSNSAHGTTQVITRTGDGLKGQTYDTDHSGVVGYDTSTASGGHGVFGRSTHGFGVFGISDHSTGMVGQCKSFNQSGVAGIDLSTATGAHGVFGASAQGDGVYASSTHGTGLRAQSAHGIALHVQGKARFAHSGVAKVSAGNDSVTVSLPGLKSDNVILATIQRPSGVAVAAAEAGNGSFKITLTGSVEGDCPVGWMAIE